MSVSQDRILLTSNLPCLFATLASQIVTLPNPYDEDAIHAYFYIALLQHVRLWA
jgi:hypothetical protein